MLRILNGGVDASPLLDPDRLAMVTGVRPEQYLDLAALRGDTSDNLPGVTGFGTKTAVKLLQALDTAEAAFDDAEGDGVRCTAAVGRARARALAADGARDRWRHNCEVMAMVTTADLGIDRSLSRGRLPLDEDAVRATYGRFELHVAGAIRALCLREPARTVTEPRMHDSWQDPRWKATVPRPKVGPLPKLVPAPAGPAYVQETLF
jgi:DNA polymerase-1